MSVLFKDPEGVAECTFDELREAVAALWPTFYRGSDRQGNDFGPIVDGHWHVGFSLRLFGPPFSTEPDRAAARKAMEQLQRGLEDMGFETTREGNAWQDGRLVLGWALDPEGRRLADLPEDHAAWMARRERLGRERGERDTVASRRATEMAWPNGKN